MRAVADAPVRTDGRCLKCGGKRRLEKLKPLYLAAMLTDPFCSTVCARSWHGTTLGPVGNPSTQARWDDTRRTRTIESRA